MRQFLVPGAIAVGREIQLHEGDYHYLAHVRRVRVGTVVSIVDLLGNTGTAAISEIGATQLVLSVTDVSEKSHGSQGPQLVLCQAVPKGRRFDQVIREAVQAGADRIIPLVTAHTVVRSDDNWGAKMDRWNRVSREATQQSGAPPIPIDPPVSIADLDIPGALGLYLHTEPIDHTTLHGYLDEVPQRVALVVGPEGGFSGEEIRLMDERDYHPLWLGARVLRSETAGLFALAAIQIVVMERQHWQLVRKQHKPKE